MPESRGLDLSGMLLGEARERDGDGGRGGEPAGYARQQGAGVIADNLHGDIAGEGNDGDADGHDPEFEGVDGVPGIDCVVRKQRQQDEGHGEEHEARAQLLPGDAADPGVQRRLHGEERGHGNGGGGRGGHAAKHGVGAEGEAQHGGDERRRAERVFGRRFAIAEERDRRREAAKAMASAMMAASPLLMVSAPQMPPRRPESARVLRPAVRSPSSSVREVQPRSRPIRRPMASARPRRWKSSKLSMRARIEGKSERVNYAGSIRDRQSATGVGQSRLRGTNRRAARCEPSCDARHESAGKRAAGNRHSTSWPRRDAIVPKERQAATHDKHPRVWRIPCGAHSRSPKYLFG